MDNEEIDNETIDNEIIDNRIRELMRNYTIPKDPHMLYSFVNVMLRDRFDSLEAFCAFNNVDQADLTQKLSAAGYEYNEEINQFR